MKPGVREPEATRFTEGGDGAQMGFFEHLDELRVRATRAFIGLVIGTVIGSIFAGQALAYIGRPYLELSNLEAFLIIDVTGSVIAYFRVALLIGGVIAVPVITHQITMFFLPALDSQQRRFFWLILPAIMALFVVGVLFAWYVLIPPALQFLEGFQDDLFVQQWEATRYIAFVTSLLFWMGVAFESPLLFFSLSLLGFVEAKALLNNWRLAVVISAALAAFITPTVDPVNMMLVMGPLLVLYAISIGLVFVGARMHQRRLNAEWQADKTVDD